MKNNIARLEMKINVWWYIDVNNTLCHDRKEFVVCLEGLYFEKLKEAMIFIISFNLRVLQKFPVYPASHPVPEMPFTRLHMLFSRHFPHVWLQSIPKVPFSQAIWRWWQHGRYLILNKPVCKRKVRYLSLFFKEVFAYISQNVLKKKWKKIT